MSFSFLFPGQGSQYNGMFKEHFEEFPEFNEILGLGEEYYKEDFKSIIFTEDPRLSDTYYTQPILMLMSYALFKVWERHKCPMPKISAGHSLGEVSALLCSGVMSFEDALKFIKCRATFMIEGKGDTKTKMSAVLGLDGSELQKILTNKKAKFLEAVNFNSPTQTVIAGNADEIELVKNDLTENGAKRVIDLAVSVPSHSSLMSIASTKLKVVLHEISLKKPDFPIIQNFQAKVPITLAEIAENLSNQVSKPVQWVSSMNRLKKYGLDMHLEFGPNKVLSGLAKQNRVTGEFASMDNIDKFKELLSTHGK